MPYVQVPLNCLGNIISISSLIFAYTSIAASTTLVTTSPVWVAILSAMWLNEKPSKLTIFGIIIALAGGTIIGLGEGNINSTSSNPILGNSLAIFGAWSISLYLIFGREAQHIKLTFTDSERETVR